MPHPTEYVLQLREVTEILVRHLGIHEGLWLLNVHYGFSCANLSLDNSPMLRPASVVVLNQLGIMRSAETNSLTVDASVCNPIAPPPNWDEELHKLQGES